MPDTFVKIATVTVGSGGAASISFSSIPSTYTDLCLKWSSRSTNAASSATLLINFNGSGSNFSWKRLRGTGAAADSYEESSVNLYSTSDGATATASTFSNGEMYIPNYSGAAYKSWSVDSVTENNATGAVAVLIAGLWSNTAAINAISFTTDSNFDQYTSMTLYGISKS